MLQFTHTNYASGRSGNDHPLLRKLLITIDSLVELGVELLKGVVSALCQFLSVKFNGAQNGVNVLYALLQTIGVFLKAKVKRGTL